MTSQITGKTALLLGATGATGHHTLRYLLASPKFSRVVEVGRRVTPADKLEEYGFKQDGAERRKLVQKVVDFEKLRTAMLQPESAGESEKTEVEKLREEKADVVIVTLGTTRAIAGSAENFTRIDSQYPIAAAKAARVTSSDEGVTNKPQRLIYLSSTSANPHSFIFYARSKGETECALAGLGYDDFIVFRPGLLVEAERQDSRTLESLYGKITGVLSHFSSNLQVSVKVLAQALVKTGELDFGKDGKAQLPECAEAAVASWQGTVPYPWICNRGVIQVAKTA